MKWINEGLTLIFISGILLITAFTYNNSALKIYINLAAIIMLILMAALLSSTEFK